MITIFKKLFGKSEPKARGPVSTSAHQEPSVPIPTVEVAHLSLAAIMARLPDELQAFVRQAPDSSATVALPLPTIHKQLHTGAVKMSFASLHRQAPAGVFSPLPPGEKRMVTVPLGEIFRHVSPRVLKRRADQRSIMLNDEGFNLFGNSANPYEISPTSHAAAPALDLSAPLPAAPRSFSSEEPAPLSGLKLDRETAPPATSRGIAPPPEYFEPKPLVHPSAANPPPAEPAPRPKSDLPPLRLPLAPLTAAWPEEIRGAVAALNGSASVELPADDVVAGLAKGKVIFTWGQIRGWIEPSFEATDVANEDTPLTLPLKVIAPAFLAASKQDKPAAKKVDVDTEIPALFSDSRSPAPAPAEYPVEPEAEPATELEPTAEASPNAEIAPAPVEEAPLQFVLEPDAGVPPASEAEAPAEMEAFRTPAPEAVIELETSPALEVEPCAELEIPAESTPAIEAATEPEPAPFTIVTEAVPAPAEAPNHPPAPVVENVPAAAPALAFGKAPESLGEAFGDPDKMQWTPGELVQGLTRLPGIAGAAVALQEGLLVAQSLPEGVKGETVAAFLPQIFARLNQYAGEMKLGEVDDILFTTHGAHCQIYRIDAVYLAVLGKPGESLPWHELRLCAEELAKHTQPS